MEDKEVFSCTLAFVAVWLFYGFKWAVLILVTIIVVAITIAKHFENGGFGKKRSDCRIENGKRKPLQSLTLNENTDYGENETERPIRTVTRRYTKPVVIKPDLPFTDLQMNRHYSARRGNILRSPEPLISQVTRHLSFSNMSAYQETAKKRPISNQVNSTLNATKMNNSYLLSPARNTSFQEASNTLFPEKPSLDLALSPVQERYSPRCFSVLNPTLNMAESPSTVKISRPSDATDGSPTFESILQKRLQKTKENPCSRQNVLAALGQKSSRKRQAYEVDSDGSFLELTYSSKRRRRDDLDDFLDSISDPFSPAKTTSNITVSSLKRPHLHKDKDSRFAALQTVDKSLHLHSDEDSRDGALHRRPQLNSNEDNRYAFLQGGSKRHHLHSDEDNRYASLQRVDGILPDPKARAKNDASTLNRLNVKAGTLTESNCSKTLTSSPRDAEDSGVVMSGSDDISTEAVKTKKMKTVTFSPDIVGEPPRKQYTRTESEVNSKLLDNVETTKKDQIASDEETNLKEQNILFSPFSVRFSPKKPLHSTDSSPLTKAKDKKIRRKVRITWKDVQENRREAWRRSQKLLDDIEKSLAQERGKSASSDTPPSTVNLGVSKSASTSLTVTTTTVPVSIAFGSTPLSLGQPLSSLPTSASSVPPVTTTVFPTSFTIKPSTSQENVCVGQFTNFIGTVPKSEVEARLARTKTAMSSQNLGASTTPVSSVSSTSSSLFSGSGGFKFGSKTATSSTNASTAGTALNLPSGTTGTIRGKGSTGDFQFAIPQGPVKSSLSFVGTTTLASTLVTTALSSSGSSPFAGFSSTSTTTTSTTGMTTLPSGSTTSNLTASRIQQNGPTNFSFVGKALSASTTSTPQTKPNISTFSFQAPSVGGASTGSAQTTKSLPTFSFQAPSGPAFGRNPPPASQLAPSTQSKPAGLFSFNAGSSNTGSLFGGASVQSSSSSGFSFASSAAPSFGSQNAGSVATGNTAGQSKPGGFSFNMPAASTASGGFNFTQTTPGNFNFGTPTPATGGFSFGGTGPGVPFASSTPMPGGAGGMAGSAFTLGSSGRGEATASRTRQRRRKK